MDQTHANASIFQEARDRGGNFLLTQQQADGGFERGLADYYKAISALGACSLSHAANQLCNWIRKHGLAPDGALGPRLPETMGYYFSYYNSWVIMGAHRIGQFDVSQRGMDYLATFWDSESGGFYCSATEKSASTPEDLWVVCGCGQAALYTGRMEIALGVGRWLRRMMDEQPDYPRKLYGVFSREKGLILDFDPSEEIRYVMSCDATRDQYFFNPGIAGGFLAGLYMSTGQSQWLDLAKEYMRFAEHASDYLFKLLRAGKVGWAASLLYTLTGESIYREMAVRVGQNLIAAQSPDGSWWFQNMCSIDITAEMVIWLNEIHQACGGAQSSSRTVTGAGTR